MRRLPRNIAAVLMESHLYDQAGAKLDEALNVILSDANQNDRRKAFSRAFHAYGLGVVAAKKGELARARTRAATLENLAGSLESTFIHELVHELNGIVAIEAKDYPLAVAELYQANDTEVYNMYRIALALDELGKAPEARKMLQYVVTYNSPLNFNYAFVRHQAADRLAALR